MRTNSELRFSCSRILVACGACVQRGVALHTLIVVWLIMLIERYANAEQNVEYVGRWYWKWLSLLPFHNLHSHRGSAGGRRDHRQQPRFRRLLEGHSQDFDFVSLPGTVTNRLGTVGQCVPAIHDGRVRGIYGHAARFVIHKFTHNPMVVSANDDSSRSIDMGDCPHCSQSLCRRVFAVQGVSMVQSFYGEETIGCGAARFSSV